MNTQANNPLHTHTLTPPSLSSGGLDTYRRDCEQGKADTLVTDLGDRQITYVSCYHIL